MKRLYVSVYQSYLFNQLFNARLSSIDRLEDADLAMKHSKGACFLVVAAEPEQARADALEVSPTGP